MAFLKKRFLLLFCFVIIYGVYFLTHHVSPTPAPQVLGTSTNLQLFVEPQDGEAPLVAAINNAQKEVLVEVYLLSDKNIISSLESAASRGVQVKVMLEEHPFGGGNSNTKTEQQLQQAHIAVMWASPAFALTHEKTIVIDNAVVFILNQNLTAAAFSKNREYDIEDTNAADIAQVRNIFIADWERKDIVPTDTNLVVSPKTSRAGLTSLLHHAQKSIDIEVEDIGDTQIEQILSEKAASIPVEILTPTLSQIASNKKALDILKKAGVSIKTLSAPYIHAKLIIVDNAKAYIGSVNLSTQSMDENREVGIIISQQDILPVVESDFTQDWQRATIFSN